jgi:hypothetical protein
VESPGRNERFDGFQEEEMAPDDLFRLILSELWSKIVRPVLNALAITVRYFNEYIQFPS